MWWKSLKAEHKFRTFLWYPMRNPRDMALLTMLWWERQAPFGFPVVP